eukprot:4060098-Amphidinium_carterae.1
MDPVCGAQWDLGHTHQDNEADTSPEVSLEGAGPKHSLHLTASAGDISHGTHDWNDWKPVKHGTARMTRMNCGSGHAQRSTSRAVLQQQIVPLVPSVGPTRASMGLHWHKPLGAMWLRELFCTLSIIKHASFKILAHAYAPVVGRDTPWWSCGPSVAAYDHPDIEHMFCLTLPSSLGQFDV